ncbi:MAG TPA: hypothetical protein QF564_23075 [Pirellulaceae bacterium]|nr:hypothetical protein [Pirellulaceae bacterium]
MNNELFSTGQVARLLGIPIHRVIYAHTSGKVQEPSLWFMGKRAYSDDDVNRVAAYFEKQLSQTNHRGGK